VGLVEQFYRLMHRFRPEQSIERFGKRRRGSCTRRLRRQVRSAVQEQARVRSRNFFRVNQNIALQFEQNCVLAPIFSNLLRTPRLQLALRLCYALASLFHVKRAQRSCTRECDDLRALTLAAAILHDQLVSCRPAEVLRISRTGGERLFNQPHQYGEER